MNTASMSTTHNKCVVQLAVTCVAQQASTTTDAPLQTIPHRCCKADQPLNLGGGSLGCSSWCMAHLQKASFPVQPQCRCIADINMQRSAHDAPLLEHQLQYALQHGNSEASPQLSVRMAECADALFPCSYHWQSAGRPYCDVAPVAAATNNLVEQQTTTLDMTMLTLSRRVAIPVRLASGATASLLTCAVTLLTCTTM